ncbi:MAG: dicarboxylate/amino acid:cation symporter [Propionibacteriaceae bacterium]
MSEGITLAPKRRFKIGLLAKICIAIILGIIFGQFFPEWAARIFATFNSIFSQFLGFTIPLIIVGLVTPAIAELGKGAGKWLGITAGIAYISTIIAGFFAYGVAMACFPALLNGSHVKEFANPEDSFLKPFFTIEIPPVFGVMTALILAFCIGVALTLIKGDTLLKASIDFRDVVTKLIEGIIIPLLPIYIFGMFLLMTMNGQIWAVISSFAKIILVVFAMTFVILIFQWSVAAGFVKRNPFIMLKNMMPAYATALGTSSSAATIPVTLRCTKKNGVPEAVADFTIPLCATIHLAGSTIKIVSFALAICIMSGKELSFGTVAGFILMLGITMVAAPGVPGGAIMAALGILASMIGFGAQEQALMIAMYIAVDSFGTAANVTGDGAIACIVERLSRGKLHFVDHDGMPTEAEIAAID